MRQHVYTLGTDGQEVFSNFDDTEQALVIQIHRLVQHGQPLSLMISICGECAPQ